MKKNKALLVSALLSIALAVPLTACSNPAPTTTETTTETVAEDVSGEVTDTVAEEERTLESYAIRAMKQAQEAADSGTFGVGGILMDLDGNVLAEMHNQVIKNGRTNDPTAHGERQIVEWYFENKEKENLPEPEQCILITTLDPCLMCTGSLAQAKFNKVIVIALDDYAGINWEGTDACHALDGTNIKDYVQGSFAYPEVTGEQAREAFGATLSDIDTFSDITISSETLQGCQDAFSLTADDVRNKVAATSVEPEDTKNPAGLEDTHPMRQYLQEALGSDFCAITWQPGDPIDGFKAYLDENHPGFNGVAYFDTFGNLIYLAEGNDAIPTQSAFMNVTRKLAAVRNTDPIDGYEINEYLNNPKYGYFLFMTCPEVSARTIMELGALGSTLENVAGNNIMYIEGKENEDAINAICKQLPPLYTSVIAIHFEHVPTDATA